MGRVDTTLLKIGLTGGIASGKSSVCTLFEHFSVPIIDADIIARQLVAPNQQAHSEIIKRFGKEILHTDDTLNRHKLRQLIFSDPIAKKNLENILHPKIRQQITLHADQQNTPYLILAIPLLIESKMTDLVDRILVIDIAPDPQLRRLQQRDGVSLQQAQLIIESQCSQTERLAYADDIIDNNSDISSLKKQAQRLHKKYIKLANGCQHSHSHGQ